MAYINADRIKETTTTTGTGAITLAGAVVGFRAFSAVMASADTCSYAIVSATGTQHEAGIGTFTSPATLTRTTVQSSSNANAAVNFSAGLKDVFIGPIAGTLVPYDPVAGTLGLSVDALNDVAITSPVTNQVLKWNGTAWTNQADAVNVGTVTSVSGTGTVSGLTLSGTVTSAGSLTLGGAIGTLNQNTTGNAATVTTNANLTGHITSVGNAAVLGSFTSAQLAGALSDETGTGAAVFANSPTLVTPLANTLSAVAVTSGAGNSLTIAAGSGVGVGAGGNIILQPGAQGSSGGNGWIKCVDVTGANTQMGVFNNATQGYGFGWDTQNNGTLGSGLRSSVVNGTGYLTIIGQLVPFFSWNTNSGAITAASPSATGYHSWRLMLVDGGTSETAAGSWALSCSKSPGTAFVRDGQSTVAGGSLAFPSSTTAISTSQNDLALTASAFQRINCTTASSITGIAPPAGGTHVDGREIMIFNTGSATLTLSHNHATLSATANKMFMSGGADLVVAVNGRADFIYDATDNGSGNAGWRVR